ncbi:MAG: hypothetical protein JJ899_14825, partial [Alphaproteobacteria bacterium]|nr:hypothetical protein [Alphaproteobacteria bacterium]
MDADRQSAGGADQTGPVQIAQASDGAPVELAQAPVRNAVGQISSLTGSVTVVRADGSRAEVGAGAQIFEGDLIVTDTGADVEVEFADGTNAFLDQEGRLLVERVTPDAPPDESSAFFVVLEGSFVFTAPDKIDAGGGRIDVRTPVATINVERGRVAGRAAPEAELNLFTLVRNFDGSLGRALVSTTAGSVALSGELQAAEVFSLFRPPSANQTTPQQVIELIGANTFDYIEVGPGDDVVSQDDQNPELVRVAQSDFQQTDAGPPQGPLGAGLGVGPDAGTEGTGNGLPGSRNTGSGAPDQGQEQDPGTQPVTGNKPIEISGPGSFTMNDSGQNFIYLSSRGGAVDVTGGAGDDTITMRGDANATNSFNVTTNGRDVVTDLGNGNTLTMRNVETLELTAGGQGDSVSLTNLNGTDITNNTVRFNGGAGNDSFDGDVAGRRIVASGGDGN